MKILYQNNMSVIAEIDGKYGMISRRLSGSPVLMSKNIETFLKFPGFQSEIELTKEDMNMINNNLSNSHREMIG